MKNGSVAIKSNSKNGYSLTEVLVSLAVLGVVSLIVFNLIAMTIEVNSKLERLDVLSDVRKEIRFKFDCSQTKLLLASACPSQFTLRDKNGNPLLQLLPKPINSIVAKCMSSFEDIQVMAYLDGESQPINLFKDVPYGC